MKINKKKILEKIKEKIRKRNEDKKRVKSFAEIQAKRREITIYLILGVFIILSILNNQSVSMVNLFQKKPSVNVKKYIIILFTSLVSCWIISKIDHKLYKKPKMKLFIAFSCLVVLLAMIFAPSSLVPNYKGAKAWLNIGFTMIQPAEMLKIPFIILMASIFSKSEEGKVSVKDTIIFSGGVFFIFAVLVYLERDLGTALHYTAIYGFMLFMTKIGRRTIEILLFLIVTGTSLLFYLVFKYADKIGSSYKVLRIQAFIDGLFFNKYDGDVGYQVGQSLLAFGNGGFLGKSYGNGIQKYSYLPEIHTDFIVALVGEELGFIGMIWLIGSFFTLYNIISTIGMNVRDSFSKYLALGIAGYIITQFLINIFVALGLLPVFGIPMPIFSYGGSSIVTIFVGIGIVLNINKSMFDKE